MSSLIDDLQVSVSSGTSYYYHYPRGGYRARRTSGKIFLFISFLLLLVLSSPKFSIRGVAATLGDEVKTQTTNPVCRFQTAGFLIETSNSMLHRLLLDVEVGMVANW